MKFLILGNMSDEQTGCYIFDAIRNLGHHSASVDTRKIINTFGMEDGQETIKHELKKFEDDKPDIILILKGKEMTDLTLSHVRNKFSNSTIINWFFDIYYGTRLIYELPNAKELTSKYDYFLCSLEGIANKLQKVGADNVYHVAEACHDPAHQPVYCNNFQKRKYGEDISFCGSIGYNKIHKNRIRILKHIIKEGFRLNIWGNITCDLKFIPPDIRPCLKNQEVINNQHSIVCQNSLINLGIDAMPNLYGGWSARLYRIMCAGGLYLSTNTFGLEDYFKVNKENEPITGDEDLVVFYSLDDLTTKLDFLLEHDKIREQIANNGRNKVLAEHTFEHRIQEIIDLVKNKKVI